MTTPSVPNSTHRAENPVEEIIEDVEEIFVPKPGGMIDSWHKNRAQREAAQREAENAAEKIEENAAFAVKTASIKPTIIRTNVVSIPAGGVAQILPFSAYRFRAIVKTSANVTLSENNGKALSGVGYPLATTDPPFVVESRGQLFASAVGAAVVSVYAEIYAPEA